MNLTLRTKRLIGPFRSQLILLAAGLLLSLSSGTAGAPDSDLHLLLQDGLVVWSFTVEADGPLTVRAHDVETGAWTNAVLVDERAACDRDCHRARGIESTP